MEDVSKCELPPDLSFNIGIKRNLGDRKRNGVFYTPKRLTGILTRWAIQKPDELVLEPSFGGCGFLVSAKDRLLELANSCPEDNLYGCDIEDAAFGILESLFANPDLEKNFLKRDFLSISNKEFPEMDVVIANPPYIKWHNMNIQQRNLAVIIANDHQVARNASLWMYFILHSLSFLKEGGRMAWILPGSFLFSDYSSVLRAVLARSFGRCLAVFLEERIFIEVGTEESSVILLCEGYKELTNEELKFVSVKGMDKLESVVNAWVDGLPAGLPLPRRPQLAMLPFNLFNAISTFIQKPTHRLLGDIATIRIGLVTGANRFFILNQHDVEKNKLPEWSIKPILAKFGQAKGIKLTTDDLASSRLNDKCLLVSCNHTQLLSDELRWYFDTFPIEEREKNYTFKKTRSVWYQIDDGVRPDAFLSAMQSDGPTIALNFARTTCTNTIYQVCFSIDISDNMRKAIAITIQSSFSQLSAEIEGRTHSGGALKLEPSEAKRLGLLIPKDVSNIDLIFDTVDGHLRDGDRQAARCVADNFLIERNVLNKLELNDLEEGLNLLRRIRGGHRK